jgi:hypothetical protein
MVGSERRWDAFVGWPIDTTCAQGRPSDFASPASFTSQCVLVSGKMWAVQQKAEFVLRYAELKLVVTVSGEGYIQESAERRARDTKICLKIIIIT